MDLKIRCGSDGGTEKSKKERDPLNTYSQREYFPGSSQLQSGLHRKRWIEYRVQFLPLAEAEPIRPPLALVLAAQERTSQHGFHQLLIIIHHETLKI